LRDGSATVAVLHSGERVALAAGEPPVRVTDVAHLEIDVPGGGQLAVVVLRAPAGATASVVGVRAQGASPGVTTSLLFTPAGPARGPHRLDLRLLPRDVA
jgi:hypothetical protein